MEERLIEVSFPYREVSELAKKERRSPRAYCLAHSWPGRRPGIVFRSLILASLLTPGSEVEFWGLLKHKGRVRIGEGKVFLDPFAGAGTCVFEALSLGMRAFGVDINAVAWFIAKTLLSHVNIVELRKAAEELLEGLKRKWSWLYETLTPDGRKVSARAFFWVKTLACPNCQSKIKLFKTYKLAKLNSKVWVYCPKCMSTSLVNDEPNPRCGHCLTPLNPVSSGRYYVCNNCGHRGKVVEAASSDGKPGMDLFAVMYAIDGSIVVKAVEEFDLKRYREAELLAQRVPHDFMDLEIKLGEETRRVLRYGYKRYRELFNARQLLILYSILKEAASSGKYRDHLLLALSRTAAFLTILTPYSYVERKPESLYALHQLMHEQMYMEINPFAKIRGSFPNALKNVIKAKSYLETHLGLVRVSSSPYERDSCDATIILGSATRLDLPDESIDLVVTDPPHFGNVAYQGLADFHFSLLRYALKDSYEEFRQERSCKESDEIALDNIRGQDIHSYRIKLTKAFGEIRRVLKPEGLFVVMFRHSCEIAWKTLYASIEDSGFEVVKEWPLECEIELQPQVKRARQKPREAVLVCRRIS